MTSYVHRVALATIEADLSAVRFASALRRGIVVTVVLVAGYYLIGPAAGAHAATAALLVGLLDKGRSPRMTWHVMASATAFLAATTLIAGALSWSPAATLVLMGLLAFASGVSVGVDMRAPQVFVYGALLTAAYLLTPVQPNDAVVAAFYVAIAGGLQTVVSWLAAPFVKDLPERRKLADALIQAATYVDEVGNPSEDSVHIARRSAMAMAAAEDFISRSDLAADHRKRYALLLADADLLRLETRAFIARERIGVPVPGDAVTRGMFSAAAHSLRLASSAVARQPAPSLTAGLWRLFKINNRHHPAVNRNSVSALVELDRVIDGMESGARGGDLSNTARAVIDATSDIPDHVRAIVEDTEIHRKHRRKSEPLSDRIADSLRWGSLPLKHGARMAAAAVTGELLSRWLGLSHGSWVAVTAMMLLRPDVGPTAPRIVMRAIGTTIGTAFVLLLAWVCQGSPVLLMLAASVVVIFMYAFISVSYNFLVALLTTTVLLILSLDEPDTFLLAEAKWVDVLVGCVIGTVFALGFPLWKRSSLASDAASYADALAGWFTAIARATTAEPDARTDALETVRNEGRRSRENRLTADATLRISLLEPPTRKEISPGTIGLLIDWLRRCSDGGIAAELLLRHGAQPGPRAAGVGLATAADLAEISASLRRGEYAAVPGPEHPSFAPDRDDPDRTTQVLLAAAAAADAALRAAHNLGQRPGSDH